MMKTNKLITTLTLFLLGFNLFGVEFLSKGQSTRNSITDKSDYYQIEIEFPTFDDFSSISKDIRDYAYEVYKSEKTMIRDYHKMDLEMDSKFIKEYSFSLRYELYESDKYISVLFTLFEYGVGAVSNIGYGSKVYSKATGKPVSLSELTGKTNYQLKKECRAQTLQQIKEENPSSSESEINGILEEIMGESIEDTPDYRMNRYVVNGTTVMVCVYWDYYGELQYYSEFLLNK